MADLFMMGSIVVGVLNTLLAAGLLIVYGSIYGRTKASFTLALIFFSTAFLAHNILVVYSYVSMMPLIPDSLAPYLLGIGGLEATGLGAMLWTATR